LAPIVSGGRV